MNEPGSSCPCLLGDNEDSMNRASSGSVACSFVPEQHPLDVSDCEFGDESDGDYPLGDPLIDDGINRDADTCSETHLPCPLDESTNLFSILNQNVSLSVQSRLRINKQTIKKTSSKKSNLIYSKQMRAAIRNNGTFANSDVAKRYFSARTNQRASELFPSHIDQSVRGIFVSKKRRRQPIMLGGCYLACAHTGGIASLFQTHCSLQRCLE